MLEHPFVFCGELLFIFDVGVLDICCLFLRCEQAVVPRVFSLFLGRRRQSVRLIVSPSLLGS